MNKVLCDILWLQAIKIFGCEKGKKNKTNLLFVAGDRVLKYLAQSYKVEKDLMGILRYDWNMQQPKAQMVSQQFVPSELTSVGGQGFSPCKEWSVITLCYVMPIFALAVIVFFPAYSSLPSTSHPIPLLGKDPFTCSFKNVKKIFLKVWSYHWRRISILLSVNVSKGAVITH